MSEGYQKKSFGGGGGDSSNSANQDKPRRLEDETAVYLSEIEQQFNAMPAHDLENRSILVNNVLTEIQSRTASAACDRRTNYLLEQLVAHADCLLLIQLLQKWTPYIIFLARNRFASHVVQTALSRLCFFLKQRDLGDIDPAFMELTVLNLAKPLIHEMFWLGKEMSASHVLRSLMCLLAGLPTVAEKKGKNSKHQHSVTLSEPLDNMLEANKFYISISYAFPVPASFKEELLAGVDSLLRKSKRDVQLMIAEISSCAMISLMMRILSNPDLFDHEAGVLRCRQLLRHALELEGEQSDSSVFYAMAGDKAGSYFLETSIECCALGLLLPLVQANVLNTAKDYAGDAHGNFILQAIAKRMIAEVEFARKNKDRVLKKEIMEVGKTLLEELVRDNFMLDMMKSKGGVVFWCLQLSQHVGEDSLAKHIAQAILRFWQLSQEQPSIFEESETSSIEVDGAEVSCQAVADFINLKITSAPTNKEDAKQKKKPPTKEGEQSQEESQQNIRGGLPDSQQLLLARLLGGLLKSNVEEVKALSAKLMTFLSAPALKVIATSGPMSKAVLDVFFLEFSNTTEFKQVGMNLANIGVELAYHFVGQHVVKKIYEASDLRGKEKWVQMLSNAKAVLSKNKEGRNAMHYMNVEVYDRDAADWRAAIKKQQKASAMMSEFSAPSSSSQANTSSSAHKSEVKESKKSKKAKVEEAVEAPAQVKAVVTAPKVVEKAVEREQEEEVVEKEDDDNDDDNDDDEDNQANANKKRKRKRKRLQGKAGGN